MKLDKTANTYDFGTGKAGRSLEYDIASENVIGTFTRSFSHYLQLTKPTIMLLVIITGATALVLEGSFLTRPLDFILFLTGLYLTGGSANAFNQYFERDIDARMSRTKKRRPLPQGALAPGRALAFAVSIGIGGVILLGVRFNLLTALLSLGTILYYSLFYTLMLKPNTPQNIVIGGVAGAMAPIGAWAAATGTIGPVAIILFLIVFIWTPPHFWSLALCFRDDYRAARLPMLPVIKGVDSTLRHIFYYSLVMVAVSLSYGLFGGGILYLTSAGILGVMFVRKAWNARKLKDRKVYWGVFTFSILYLFGLFAAMVIDTFVSGVLHL